MELETGDGEYRAQVTSKKAVVEHIRKYKEVLKKVLEEQPDVGEEAKQLLLQELLVNFETAVQDNVLVDGQAWDDAPDDDEAEALAGQLDEAVLQTSRKRSKQPKKILLHVVRTLKAQRALLGLYEPTVKPQELEKDPVQEKIMSSLSAAAPGIVKQAIHTIKSLQSLQQQAEGLRQVLHMTPDPASLEIYNEVFGDAAQSDAPVPPVGGASRPRQTVKRAVEEAETVNCYAPPTKGTRFDG